MIVVASPINSNVEQCGRKYRTVKYRPMPQSGLERMRDWFRSQTWQEIYEVESAHEKAKIFQNMLIKSWEEFLPEKIGKFSDDDKPWMNSKLKALDRKRKRIFRKERQSDRWKTADEVFKIEVEKAKKSFYNRMIADLKVTNPSKWYSSLKRISSKDSRSEQINVEEINHLDDQKQAEVIADKFCEIPNKFDALKKDDIVIP